MILFNKYKLYSSLLEEKDEDKKKHFISYLKSLPITESEFKEILKYFEWIINDELSISLGYCLYLYEIGI